MDRPHPDQPRASIFSLLRPAVPPRTGAAPARRTEMEGPLGPFAPRPPAAPAQEGAPPFDYEAEEISSGDDAEWLDYEASAHAPMAEDALEPLAEAAEPNQEPLVGEELLAPPEWAYGFAESDDAEPEERAAPAASQAAHPAPRSAALEDVAARLEQIARSLRGRTPTELLSGAHDPLQVLIAGYALGLEAARAAQEHPPEER